MELNSEILQNWELVFWPSLWVLGWRRRSGCPRRVGLSRVGWTDQRPSRQRGVARTEPRIGRADRRMSVGVRGRDSGLPRLRRGRPELNRCWILLTRPGLGYPQPLSCVCFLCNCRTASVRCLYSLKIIQLRFCNFILVINQRLVFLCWYFFIIIFLYFEFNWYIFVKNTYCAS